MIVIHSLLLLRAYTHIVNQYPAVQVLEHKCEHLLEVPCLAVALQETQIKGDGFCLDVVLSL